jgi:uncharacterized protein (UPF0335 family)
MSDTATVQLIGPDGEASKPISLDQFQAATRRARAPMKENEADKAVTMDVTLAAREELRSFVERYEQLDREKADIAEQMKEVMAEAKSRGYDTKVLRKIIALRKRDPQDLSEEEAILALYKEALGM